MAIDRDKLCDAVIDIMHEQGNNVFCLGWDGNHPGGSGANYVNEWNGLYFITSSDYDPEGPFSSPKDRTAEEVTSKCRRADGIVRRGGTLS